MRMKTILHCALGILILSAFVGYVPAQKFEFTPYAGGFFPGKWDRDNNGNGDLELKNEGIYGLRASGYIKERWQIEGNFGYINHFEFKEFDPESRAFLYDANFVYNFPTTTIGRRFSPYLSIGAGGLTARVDEDFRAVSSSRFNAEKARLGGDEETVVFPFTSWENGDTWFNINYGGGLKGVRLWGPMGVMADFRGRTFPNFQGGNFTWFEVSGGLVFTVGE